MKEGKPPDHAVGDSAPKPGLRETRLYFSHLYPMQDVRCFDPAAG